MDKMVYLYSRYLNEVCHCYANENGNRPCDTCLPKTKLYG